MSGATDGDEVPKLRLTDDGVDTPAELVGRTGTILVEKPHLELGVTFAEPIREVEPELLTFPPTGEKCRGFDIPEGYVRIDGRLYEVVDDRDLNECPHCGSDQIAAHDTPSTCYGCDTTLRRVRTDGGQLVDREVGDSWEHSQMGVKAQEVTISRGEHEETRIEVYRKEKQTFASLETGEPETTERWVEIASLTQQAATETLFALAECHGYELEVK